MTGCVCCLSCFFHIHWLLWNVLPDLCICSLMTKCTVSTWVTCVYIFTYIFLSVLSIKYCFIWINHICMYLLCCKLFYKLALDILLNYCLFNKLIFYMKNTNITHKHLRKTITLLHIFLTQHSQLYPIILNMLYILSHLAVLFSTASISFTRMMSYVEIRVSVL